MKTMFLLFVMLTSSITVFASFSDSKGTQIASCTAPAQGDWPAEAFKVFFDGQDKNSNKSYTMIRDGAINPQTGTSEYPANSVEWQNNGGTLHLEFMGNLLSVVLHNGTAKNSTLSTAGTDPRNLTCSVKLPVALVY